MQKTQNKPKPEKGTRQQQQQQQQRLRAEAVGDKTRKQSNTIALKHNCYFALFSLLIRHSRCCCLCLCRCHCRLRGQPKSKLSFCSNLVWRTPRWQRQQQHNSSSNSAISNNKSNNNKVFGFIFKTQPLFFSLIYHFSLLSRPSFVQQTAKWDRAGVAEGATRQQQTHRRLVGGHKSQGSRQMESSRTCHWHWHWQLP